MEKLEIIRIINYYSKLIYNETINVNNQEKICPIGKKIILKIWEKWLIFYLKFSIKLLSKNFSNEEFNINSFKEKIFRNNENIKLKLLQENNESCKNFINLFFELYYTLIHEFIDITISLIKNNYNKKIIIENIGEFLHLICMNTIFLTVEIKNICNKCKYILQNTNEITIFLNDFYFINNYGIKKIKKISNIIENKNILIILDCKYLSYKNNKEIYKVVKQFKKYFSKIKIINLKSKGQL